jgi:TRAP-type mannitol/chloroaromatic compound transport system substrate-binding protein
MKRRSFLKRAAAGAVATTVAAPAIAQSQPKIQWRLAASWTKSLDTLFGGADLVAKRVSEATGGNFQIRTFAAGEIVPALQVLDAVHAGTVEMGHTAAYYYAGKDPAFAIATAIPFGLGCRQQTAWWYEGGGEQIMAPLFKEYGCVALIAGNTGAQMGGWWRKEINSLADLQGVKFRIGGLVAGQVCKQLGAVPQSLGAPDIYPALEKGAIDAAEWVGPYDDEKLGFNKVAKYYYFPGWWEPGPALVTLVNEKKWNELPKNYQAILRAACGEANSWMPAKYDADNPNALKRLIAGGTQLRPFPKDMMDAAIKAAFGFYEGEYMSKSAHWKRIYPQWKKFRADSNSWFRIDENTDDNFRLHSQVGMG